MLDFLIITIIILLITRWYQLKPFFWKDAGIPYDAAPLPVFGSMFGALYNPLRDHFSNLYKNIGDGPMYGFHFFAQPSLVLRDANLVKIVTTTETDKFMDRGLHTESYDPMSKGLFFARGEEWKVFRSKMTPYFTPLRIKGMIPYVKPIAENFTKHLGNLGKNGPVNVHTASMKYAVDVVMSTVFGLQPDSFDNPNSFFFGLQRELISFLFGIKLLLGNLSPFIYGLLGLTVFSKPTTKNIKQFVNDIIDQRVRGVGNRPDFVQGMVELMQKEESMNNSEVKQISNSPAVTKFDRFCITGQCMLMYAAGTETTGNSLSLVLYELAMNPEIQQTAREEIQSMIKRTNNEYDFEDLHNLHFVNMVLKETQRKYPVLVLFGRQCTQSFELDGIQIPKGALVFIPILCLHHDPEYFPEPEKFIPERFSDESNIIPGSYVPFGMGPRTCIGMKFALTEMVLSLCKLLPKYKLSVSSKTEIPIKFSFNPTLSPASGGIWLNIEEIES